MTILHAIAIYSYLIASFTFLACQVHLVSTCEFDQVTPKITGIIGETVHVECGATNCGQEHTASTLYIIFEGEASDYPQPYDYQINDTHYECNDTQCYKNCLLTLQETMNKKTLYCFLSSINRSVKKSSGIKVQVQTSLNKIYGFKLEEATSSHLKASWNPPSNVLEGIKIVYKVWYQVPHSLDHRTCNPYNCCSPTVKETDSPEIRIEIQYGDTCQNSLMSIEPIAVSANAEKNLSGPSNFEEIEIPPSDFLLNEATEIQPFLESSEKFTVHIQFKEKDNCSCLAHMPKTAQVRYQISETGNYNSQTATVIKKVEQEVCYNVIERNNLIYPRKKLRIALEVVLENLGGKTAQSQPIVLSTYDSQRVEFNETGTTQCITVGYATDIANNPLIKGSKITFRPLYTESGDNEIETFTINKLPNKNSVSNCDSLSLYNGVYDMCVADYKEEECAIMKTVAVVSNPSPSPSPSPSSSHVLTTTVTVTHTVTSNSTDTSCHAYETTTIVFGALFFISGICIIIIIVVFPCRKKIKIGSIDKITDCWKKLKNKQQPAENSGSAGQEC